MAFRRPARLSFVLSQLSAPRISPDGTRVLYNVSDADAPAPVQDLRSIR